MQQDGVTENVIDMDLFLRIARHRMMDHYLIKLLRAIRELNQEELWRHPTEQLNSTGGIVLHIAEQVQRSANRYRTAMYVSHGQGIEEYFPDTGISPGELASMVERVFSEWHGAVSQVAVQARHAEDMHHLFHLIEHTGYHLGQIIDRVQWMTSVSFQFCQNGLNERNLRLLIENS